MRPSLATQSRFWSGRCADTALCESMESSQSCRVPCRRGNRSRGCRRDPPLQWMPLSLVRITAGRPQGHPPQRGLAHAAGLELCRASKIGAGYLVRAIRAAEDQPQQIEAPPCIVGALMPEGSRIRPQGPCRWKRHVCDSRGVWQAAHLPSRTSQLKLKVGMRTRELHMSAAVLELAGGPKPADAARAPRGGSAAYHVSQLAHSSLSQPYLCTGSRRPRVMHSDVHQD